ncbi:MAG TPA: hypothetical protein VNC63_13830, partial [Propionibacteriaceae bacterium]|nr:hypothetical protein [Propionibacteriaceae bacterium]
MAVYTQYGHPGLRLVRGGTLDQPLERGAGPGGRALVLPATSAPTSGPWHVSMAVCATLSTLSQV